MSLLYTAASAVMGDKDLGLLQTVYSAGQLQLQHRLLGRCLELDPGLILFVGAEGADGLEIQIRQGEVNAACFLADIADTHLSGLGPEQRNVDEIQHASGRFAVPVHDFVQ